MTRTLAVTAIAMAALWASAPPAFAEMAASGSESGPGTFGGSQLAAGSKAKASASASASSSASAGKQGCEASASSSAEVVAGDKRAHDRDEKTARDSGDGCSASARSSATATTGGEEQETKKPD